MSSRTKLRFVYRDGQDFADGVRGAYRIRQAEEGWKRPWIADFKEAGADWVEIGRGINPGEAKHQAREWDAR
ncbi:Uncharacterised protein [Mycobacteroides abscessus subsp. abscessus]|uniref:hypothetical protein n=1 Tax=Mycobacteroides abscessus TaxID=36809 RepID=UPI00092A342A|nr:hypothetical protein [Mycobacteroides abscessus]SHU66479.1 Uncharacterised protein [Mycobacteroides abscessus subsp. abscessus]